MVVVAENGWQIGLIRRFCDYCGLRMIANNYRSMPHRVAVKIGLGSVGIHREFITAATRWIMEAKL